MCVVKVHKSAPKSYMQYTPQQLKNAFAIKQYCVIHLIWSRNPAQALQQVTNLNKVKLWRLIITIHCTLQNNSIIMIYLRKTPLLVLLFFGLRNLISIISRYFKMYLILSVRKVNASNLRSVHTVKPAINLNKTLILEVTGNQNNITIVMFRI